MGFATPTKTPKGMAAKDSVISMPFRMRSVLCFLVVQNPQVFDGSESTGSQFDLPLALPFSCQENKLPGHNCPKP